MRAMMAGISVAIFLCASFPACARTWHVPDEVPTIQAGMDSAAAGDTVLVACGTYYEHDISWRTSGITLRSETGEPDCVTVDAQRLGRGFYVNTGMSSFARMEGFTVTGGSAAASYGGGMYWDRSDPNSQIANCIFTGNDAYYGGGVAVRTCSPLITDCRFTGNAAVKGGGAYVIYGSPSFHFCTLAGNSATGDGGGMHLDPISNPSVAYCTFYGNSAGSGQGGGVRVVGCWYPVIAQTILAFSTVGDAVSWDGGGNLYIHHSCVFGNAGGDNLPGTHYDNIFEDPLFCGAASGDFTLHADSPCLPESNPWEVLIGAHDAGCGFAIKATVDLDPNTLNCRSQGRYVTCYIELPEGYDPTDIDVATVALNDSLPALSWPTEVRDYDVDGIPDRMVKFDRSDVIELLPVGEEVEVTVSGELVEGTPFAGVDSIRVFCKRTPASRLPPPLPPSLRVRPGEMPSCATISYELGAGGVVRLRVYDVSGRLVRTLVDGPQGKGHHDVPWDGRSDDGRRVGAGVYFVRLELGSETTAGKLVLMK
jgi:hypothetical protein